MGGILVSPVQKARGIFRVKPVVIVGALEDAFELIDAAHKLAPANDLADKAFQAVEREVVLRMQLQRPIDHLLRRQQADVECWCQQRVKEE